MEMVYLFALILQFLYGYIILLENNSVLKPMLIDSLELKSTKIESMCELCSRPSELNLVPWMG